MAYGFEIYESDGSLRFSSLDQTWTVLGYYKTPANTSQTYTNVPVMNTRLVTRQMLNQVTGDDEAYVHTYTLSGSTLTTTAPNTSNTVETFFVVWGK
jgi:hypothetical protein